MTDDIGNREKEETKVYIGNLGKVASQSPNNEILVANTQTEIKIADSVFNYNTHTSKYYNVGKYAYHEPKKVNELANNRQMI